MALALAATPAPGAEHSGSGGSGSAVIAAAYATLIGLRPLYLFLPQEVAEAAAPLLPRSWRRDGAWRTFFLGRDLRTATCEFFFFFFLFLFLFLPF